MWRTQPPLQLHAMPQQRLQLGCMQATVLRTPCRGEVVLWLAEYMLARHLCCEPAAAARPAGTALAPSLHKRQPPKGGSTASAWLLCLSLLYSVQDFSCLWLVTTMLEAAVIAACPRLWRHSPEPKWSKLALL